KDAFRLACAFGGGDRRPQLLGLRLQRGLRVRAVPLQFADEHVDAVRDGVEHVVFGRYRQTLLEITSRQHFECLQQRGDALRGKPQLSAAAAVGYDRYCISHSTARTSSAKSCVGMPGRATRRYTFAIILPSGLMAMIMASAEKLPTSVSPE